MFLQTFNWDRAVLLNAFGTALAPCEYGAVSIQSEFISQGLILMEWIRYNSPVLSDTVIDQYLESIKERARSKEGRNSVGNYKFIAPLGCVITGINPEAILWGATTMTTHCAPACIHVLPVKPLRVWARGVEAWGGLRDRRSWSFGGGGLQGPPA